MTDAKSWRTCLWISCNQRNAPGKGPALIGGFTQLYALIGRGRSRTEIGTSDLENSGHIHCFLWNVTQRKVLGEKAKDSMCGNNKYHEMLLTALAQLNQ